MLTPNLPNDPVSKLIFELSKLPGIGEKTATRLAYYILKQDSLYSEALSDALLNAKKKTLLCENCFSFTDSSPCRICAQTHRNSALICVVERPSDILAIERAATHRGVYHVLHGLLSPLDGIGPEDLKIKELLHRVATSSIPIQEIIIATNPGVEGEATALYLSKLIKPMGIRLSKLAYGIPVGGVLEYTDYQTIGKAIENRVEIH